jgi:hypothetical protein
MKNLFCKGQLSIEYLLLLAAFLSFIACIIPLFGTIYNIAVFGIDCNAGKDFLNSVASASGELMLFGEGSERTVESKILTFWELKKEGNVLFLAVNNSALGKQKIFSRKVSENIELKKMAFSEKATLKLLRKENSVLIKNLYNE